MHGNVHHGNLMMRAADPVSHQKTVSCILETSPPPLNLDDTSQAQIPTITYRIRINGKDTVQLSIQQQQLTTHRGPLHPLA